MSVTESNNRSHSGIGMDKVVTRESTLVSKLIPYVVVLIILITGYLLLSPSQSASLNIDHNNITTAEVRVGTFEDFLPVRSRVTPSKTVFLDAIEGGRVERIFVEDGSIVNEGDLIVELSNTTLQLDVTRNEAMVIEQLNSMRAIELSLEQNRLRHKHNLIDIRYQIKILTRQLTREKDLLASNAIARSQYDDTFDTFQWYKDRLNITLETQKTDAMMQEQQLEFLKISGAQLEKNLTISQENLENMRVRAPVSGKLSGLAVEIGQSIVLGGRLGQIDSPDDFKLTAFVDEFYLPRTAIGQLAILNHNDATYTLEIKKIYPQVRDGEFQIDLFFEGQQPDNIRRGQSIQIKLTLDDPSEALLIPNSAFYQTTGGNWIFVLSKDGDYAVRRSIQVGRRNNLYIEVLSGLEAGERIITSSYKEYQQVERLSL